MCIVNSTRLYEVNEPVNIKIIERVLFKITIYFSDISFIARYLKI
jgi:hypothetical protein